MARTSSIIVGGGIQAGAPFTLGGITLVSSVTPPAIATGEMFQRLQGGVQVITVGLPWVLPNTFTEKLQVVGGLITDTGVTGGVAHGNVLIGQGATAPSAANAKNTIIGTGARGATGTATNNVVIGADVSMANAAWANIGSCTLIGATLTLGNNFPTVTTVIGSGNTIDNAFAGPGIGVGSSWQGAGVGIGNQQTTSAVNSWTLIGRLSQANAANVTVIGDDARGNHAQAIVLGKGGRSVVANGLVIGAGGGLQISTVQIGAGDTQVGGQAVTYRHTNGSGADDPAGNVTWIAGLGTGTAVTLGRIIFQTGLVQGASSSVVQTATTRFTVLPSTGAAAAPILEFAGYTDGAAAAVATFANAPLARNAIAYIPVQTLAGQGWIPVV